MSGFAGILTNHGRPPSEGQLKAMARSLRHRGGDEEGHYATGGLGVVHSRLASKEYEADEQPMFDQAGGVLVADAEFSSLSEGSQIPNPIDAYRRLGSKFAEEMVGSFALALFDPASRTLMLARDRFGTRPLYYLETDEGLLFGSEIDCFRQLNLNVAKLNADAVDQLLQLQFTCGRRTVFENIQRVLPGETLVAQNGKVVERHRPETVPRGGVNHFDKERSLQELTDTLNSSFDRCLERSIPTGIVFSGDIETAVLLDSIHERGHPAPLVFSPSLLGAAGAADRERTGYYAEQLGVETSAVQVGPEDFWNDMPKVVQALDDPVADYSALYAYKLAEEAASQVKIMLSATGANEIFAGRSRYRRALRPLWLGGKAMYARGFMEDLELLRVERSSWRDGIGAAQNRINPVVYTKLQQSQALDLGDWLSNDLLTTLDRCFAQHSIELRYPYLDAGVVELAFRLEGKLKISRGLGKALLRARLQQKYAEPIVMRRSRLSSIPVREWMSSRAHLLAPLVAKSPGVQEICKTEAVEALFKSVQSQKNKRQGLAAWQILFYALWHKIHVEGASSEGSILDVLDAH